MNPLGTTELSSFHDDKSTLDMKLMFSWQALPNGDQYAHCTSDRLNPWGISPLADALGDDGGLGIEHTIKWIDDAIDKANRALAGASSVQLWGRACFAIEFQGDRGSAFSLSVPDCAEALPTIEILGVLQQWKTFLMDGPAAGSRVLDIAEN
ncbi:hypothetical protein [Burkholderia sp. Ac-20379]|uniref:hypothetical protein n=1 Tax=Burkholderia sp. Ac-20379 TaxID=2703900 RepID=UPI0019803D32|nr:hypothetical protein [Burkholderia sp. Ac-20379]MBN3725459.1 hypothetical protein [Burkholderia sp. Ac-20379]